MQTFKKYEQAIIDFLNNYANLYKNGRSQLSPKIVVDKESHQYLLTITGWDEDRYVYGLLFHFEIINEKIWLQQNATECLVDKELAKYGVPKSDIVLGFKSPFANKHAGFGVPVEA